MKVHLIRITVIVLALGGSLLATPVAARPKDPDSFQVTLIQRGGCYFGASFGDPPIGLCPADLPELAANRAGSRRPATAQEVLHNATDAVTRTGSLQYPQEMRTTNFSGGPRTTGSTLMGDHVAPDRLHGAVTIATP